MRLDFIVLPCQGVYVVPFVFGVADVDNVLVVDVGVLDLVPQHVVDVHVVVVDVHVVVAVDGGVLDPVHWNRRTKQGDLRILRRRLPVDFCCC